MKILTIGPYERDNFGDILFFYVFEKLLTGNLIVPASLTGVAKEFSPLDRTIYPYDLALKAYKWDAIAIIGGEIGGADIDKALAMSARRDFSDVFILSNEYIRTAIKSALSIPVKGYAYIPFLPEYRLNRETKIFINSIGGMKHISRDADHKLLPVSNFQSFRDAAWISVRDDQSYSFFQEEGISAFLAPDIVHILPRFLPKMTSKIRYVTFQISKEVSKQFDINYLCKQLINLCVKREFEIILVPAGTASGHDDMEIYNKIKKYISSKSEVKVSIFTNRNPVNIAETIGSSSLWVGSSLHGRIISASYAVPRVSLEKLKVTNYSKKWDSKMPYSVTQANLLQSCEEALSAKQDHLDRVAKKLIDLAMNNAANMINEFDNVKKIVKSSQSKSSDYIGALLDQSIISQNSSVELLMQQILSRESEYIEQQRITKDLSEKLRNINTEFEATKKEIASMKQSKFWKAKEKYSKAKKIIGFDK